MLPVLLMLAVFGIVFVLVLAVVIRLEVAREQAIRSEGAGEEASVE